MRFRSTGDPFITPRQRATARPVHWYSVRMSGYRVFMVRARSKKEVLAEYGKQGTILSVELWRP